MQNDEWGPWVEHDQSGCPVPDGTVVWIYAIDPLGEKLVEDIRMIGRDWSREDWDWCDQHVQSLRQLTGNVYGILRYRIRKPKGLTILEEAVKEVTAPQPIEVPA